VYSNAVVASIFWYRVTTVIFVSQRTWREKLAPILKRVVIVAGHDAAPMRSLWQPSHHRLQSSQPISDLIKPTQPSVAELAKHYSVSGRRRLLPINKVADRRCTKVLQSASTTRRFLRQAKCGVHALMKYSLHNVHSIDINAKRTKSKSTM